MKTYDLANQSVRELNQALHDLPADADDAFTVLNPNGAHAVACGIDAPIDVTVLGHTGYYSAGMHKLGRVTIEGNVGVGVAENMMSGEVRVRGNASQAAGATAHGGLLVIDGDASARCGISLKGADIVVKGSVGHMSCFMAQAGCVVVCGDAGEALGDSLYEVHIYVKGEVKSLGADCIEKEMREEHITELQALLDRADIAEDPRNFKRYGSARQLYTFKVDNAVL
jgi:glutamate synthase domain-containing protein 3